MNKMGADRLFFYLLLLLVTILTLWMVWTYIGSIILAITVAVVLQPMHTWFLGRTGQRKGPATALTMMSALLLMVIPVLFGTFLLFDSFVTLSADVTEAVQHQENSLLDEVRQIDHWLRDSGIAERLQLEQDEVTSTVREFVANGGVALARWLTSVGLSTFNLVIPMIVFASLLGTLLTNNRRAVALFKELSPMPDSIDQLFMDRLRIMTKAMMRSIVVVALVQGGVTGLLMALGGTPHIIPLTLLAILLSIIPGGAAIIAVPVGLAHMAVGELWAGALIILGTITFVASLDNQVRPMLVSKDAYLNRAFVLLSVFSGIAVFGFMGVVYGPLIMILFTTVVDVYLDYYRPDPPAIDPMATEQSTLATEASDGVAGSETQHLSG